MQQEKKYLYGDRIIILEGIGSKLKIILEDINAKIGKETSFRSTIGFHSLPK